jgi:hypothetical protein
LSPKLANFLDQTFWKVEDLYGFSAKLLFRRIPFQEVEQRLFCWVQLSPAVGDEIFRCLKIVVNCLSSLEAVEDFGTYVRTATNGGRIAKCLGRLFDGCHYLFSASSFILAIVVSGASQGTSADECPGPGAKVLGAEMSAHHFLDIFIDVPAL